MGGMEPIEIEISYNGQPATTAVIAARRHGMQAQALRHTLARAGIRPIGELDSRTPLYLTGDIDRHMASRPGRHGRRATAAG